MERTHQGTLLAYIDPLRSRVVGLVGLMVALSSLAVVLSWLLASGSSLSVDPLGLRLMLLQAGLALAAAALARFGKRPWGARLLALDLILIPTLVVHAMDQPFIITFASYVGALLIAALGARGFDIVGTAVSALLLTAISARAEFAPPSLWPVLASSLLLLLVTGAMLAWLVEALRRGIVGLEASEARFQRLSHLDPLTGLGNRRLFDETLANLLGTPSPNCSAALVVLDVDNLKQINDTLGHLAGDQALLTVAQAIRASIRERDIPTRIGGDEFAVILTSGGLRGAQQIADRIRERLDGLSTSAPGSPTCTVSIGVAAQRSANQTPEELLAAADAQLYASRNHIRRAVVPAATPPSSESSPSIR